MMQGLTQIMPDVCLKAVTLPRYLPPSSRSTRLDDVTEGITYREMSEFDSKYASYVFRSGTIIHRKLCETSIRAFYAIQYLLEHSSAY